MSKNTPNRQKIKICWGHGCVRSITFWGYSPLEVNSWCFCIVPRSKSTVDAMVTGSHFFPWCQGAKKKDLVSKCSFLNVGEYSTFPRCCVKNSYIFSNYIKNEFNHFDFLFFCDVIFRRWIGLENWQNFFKHHVFPVLRVHKNDPMTLDLYVVDTVSIDMRANL